MSGMKHTPALSNTLLNKSLSQWCKYYNDYFYRPELPCLLSEEEKKKKGKSEFPSTVLKKINIIYDKGKNNKKIVNNLCTFDSVLWETREFKNFIKHLC